MTEKIVVGLFEARGIAEDARNRLVTEGFPPAEIALIPLRETAPLPAQVDAEMAALEIDPLMWGNVRDSYAPYIRNGETVVFVRAMTEDDVDGAIDTMRLFAPLQITVTPAKAQVNGV